MARIIEIKIDGEAGSYEAVVKRITERNRRMTTSSPSAVHRMTTSVHIAARITDAFPKVAQLDSQTEQPSASVTGVTFSDDIPAVQEDDSDPDDDKPP